MNIHQSLQKLESLIEAADAVIAQLETFRVKATTLKSELAKAPSILTAEEEFRQKYPSIKIESEFFQLVGCITPMPSNLTDKDRLINTTTLSRFSSFLFSPAFAM